MLGKYYQDLDSGLRQKNITIPMVYCLALSILFIKCWTIDGYLSIIFFILLEYFRKRNRTPIFWASLGQKLRIFRMLYIFNSIDNFIVNILLARTLIVELRFTEKCKKGWIIEKKQTLIKTQQGVSCSKIVQLPVQVLPEAKIFFG